MHRLRRHLQLARIKPGDGTAPQRYALWQLFSRSHFELGTPDHVYEVDVRHAADSTTRRSPASLYRDGVQVARATLPVTFPVSGGVIEVATSQYGVKRMHFVRDDGRVEVLRPHPRSHEGLRARFGARFPRASAAIGVVATVVLGLVLVSGLVRGLEAVTRSPAVAERVGTFVSPVPLTGWTLVALAVAGALAGLERGLTLRYHWLIRG